jgi:hypothetical protein
MDRSTTTWSNEVHAAQTDASSLHAGNESAGLVPLYSNEKSTKWSSRDEKALDI